MTTTLPLSIEYHAANDPDAHAILAPGKEALSYAALRHQVRTIVRALTVAGIGPGDRVVVVLPNGPVMATCVMGVMSTAICAPLNPALRADEFDFCLGDLDARALIVLAGTETPARAVAARREIRVIEIMPDPGGPAGRFAATSDGNPSTDGLPLAGPNDVALVLHTSGTTARPKLVPLTQANLMASARHIGATLQLTPGDRCLNVMPLFHIHGLVGALLASIAAGGQVVCTPGFEAPAFFGWLRACRPTWYTAVPTMHQAILARARADGLAESTLRFIRSSSAPLAPPVMAALEDLFGVPVIESYGMTEAAHQMASNPLPPGRRKAGSVGRPAGSEMRVVDAAGAAVPAGCTGEVVIRGPNVTPGYADGAGANAEAFHDGWFRTGDQGYFDAEGYLFLTGRLKEIINRGGEKISPRELDEILMTHPAVVEAVSFALPDERLGEDVGAAVVLAPDARPVTKLALKEFVASRAADYKVPRCIAIVDKIPVGPSGKPQRIGLGERIGLTTPRVWGHNVPFEELATPNEVLVGRLWREVLGLDQVGARDNFFSLGGDSVLVTQFAVGLQAATGAELSVARFFDDPTLRSVARWLDEQESIGVDQLLEPIRRRPQTPKVLPSFAEERMWFVARLTEQPAVLNRPALFRLRGPLDPDALGRSLTAIVARHEVLRTTYHDVDGGVLPVIGPPRPVEVTRVDLTDWPAADRLVRVREIVGEAGRRPFDISKDLMLRASLFRVGTEEHLLFLNMHHITSDGWSSRLVLKELAALYKADVSNAPVQLPELRVQYSDYASWQRQRLRGALREAHMTYWTTTLADLPPPLELPADHARPVKRTYRSRRRSIVLSRQLANALRAFCAIESATLFMILLAGFELLLSRYTGRTEFLVGTVTSNRTRRETESLIGLFMNTLALRADVPSDATFRTLLTRVRASTVAAYEHQEMPYHEVVGALNPRRRSDIDPVIQVFFQLRNLPPSVTEAHDLSIEELETDLGVNEFDLGLEARECAAGIECLATFNSGLFEAETIDRLLGHYQSLLGAAVAAPDQLVTLLPLLTAQERQTILVEWNDTAAARPDISVTELFERQAARTPGLTALRTSDAILSYDDLNQRANRLAHRLRGLGVGPGVRVGLCLERSFELLVAILGTLKAGGAYVPLDPEYPRARLALMLEDASPRVVLCTTGIRERLPPHGSPTVLLDGPHSAGENDSAVGNLPRAVSSDDAAYVIYTSGSTGRPKGVVISHAALSNFVLLYRSVLAITEADRIFPTASFSFDQFVSETFPALTAGASLILHRPGGQRDPAHLAQLFADKQATVIDIVPSLFSVLIEQPDFARNTSLRIAVLGGETLPPRLQERFFELFDAELYNSYGPTETTVWATQWRCRPGWSQPRIPIGRPLPNYQVYVLDSHLQPLPVGVPGELHIGGAGVALGYLNAPELTAEKFIPNPFSRAQGARLYKTGDLARFLPDGTLDLLGRLDHQVKIRGFRIELSEIEWVLSRHPDVHEAVAIARDEKNGSPTLLAYFTSEAAGSPTPSELRDFLLEALPDYMVPSWFVRLDGLPRTPNDKLDRSALPAPDAVVHHAPGEVTGLAFGSPARSTVTALASITAVWCDVLGHKLVEPTADFFTIGGDSLKAAQCVARINRALGSDLSLPAFLEQPTVAAIANAIGDHPAAAAVSRIPRRGSDDPCALSFGQKRIWFLDRLEPDSPKYNVVEAFRWKGRLDVAALTRALRNLVERHQSLRTTYHDVAGKSVQVVGDAIPLEIGYTDLRLVPASTREADLDRQLRAEASRPFDLSRDLALRSAVWHLADNESVVLINIHHIACDGWSFSILHRELAACYEAFSTGRSPMLPELPIQYADFALWQAQQLHTDRLQIGLRYWRERLSDHLEPLTLPGDKVHADATDFRAGTSMRFIPSALVGKLEELGERAGVTLFTVLVAGFQALLCRLSGQTDVAIGTPMAAREQQECEGLIGLFTNTVVLRLDLSGDPTFETLLYRARDMVLGALAHQGVPFDQVVQAINPSREQGHNPLFDIMLEFNTQEWNSLRIADAEIDSMLVPNPLARFALTLHVNQRAGGVHLRALYRQALFSTQLIDRMLRQFVRLLESVVADPTTTVSGIQLLTETEHQLILEEWNDTGADYPADRCIHQLIEDQVELTPDAVAVQCGEIRLTFRELNRQANRLAHAARALGVGPGSLVGIYMERRPAMFSAIVGILKAGGAYVPLDRRWPEFRLGQIIDDACLSAVVTDREGEASLPDHVQHVIRADSPGDLPSATDDAVEANPRPLAAPGDLAYVIYTSGSTGEPKGVLIEHRALVNYAWGILERLELRSLRTFALVQPLSVDSSVTVIYGALLAGGCLHLISEDDSLNPAALSTYFATHAIDCVKIAPSHLMALNTELPQPLMPRKLLVVGGEASRAEWIAALRVAAPECRIVNHYGPTEATVAVTTYQIMDEGGAPDSRTVPIGRPLPNVRTYVLDEHGQPVPPGVAGELYLGGDCLARGYLNRPTATARAFVPDPFGGNGGRLFRTGDRARYLPTGDLEYLGREDGQVKVRGYRVELGEIEAAIALHPGITDVAVITENDGGETRLVAAVATRAPGDLTLGALRRFLKERLPDYMLPSALVLVDALPRTGPGKLDRISLRRTLQHTGQAPDAGTENKAHCAARTPVEMALVEIWSAVLDLDGFGVHDNFFDVGGHSLSVMQVISRVRGVLGVDLPVRVLFDAPTIAELAETIENAAPRASNG